MVWALSMPCALWLNCGLISISLQMLLGKSSLDISAVGFGCASLSDSDASGEKLLHEALDSGINFFDTADLYQQGLNEELVGKALKDRRHKAIIATKVGNQWRSDGRGWDWNPRKSYIMQAVEKSLQRLRTDHIDLYQLHGGTLEDPIDETIGAFEALCQQGKVRYYGISSIRPNVIREWVQRSNIVSVMMQYSLLDRRPEEFCLDLLQQHHIGVLARGSLAKGLLVSKPPAPFLHHDAQQVREAARAVHAVSGPLRGPAATAIGFILRHPAITSAVVGIRTSEQLVQAVEVFRAPPLTDSEWRSLQDAVPIDQYDQHR